MKKNVLIKGILVLVVIAVFALTLVGCDGFTGTVYLVVSGSSWKTYNLYMDSIQQYLGVSPGTYVISNVPIGNHFFEAYEVWGVWGYDSVNQNIHIGPNYVYLYP